MMPRYQRLCDWVEANNRTDFQLLPAAQQHHKHLKSSSMLERVNEKLKRRTHVIRIFPNAASCLRLVRALAEIHENWIEAIRLPKHGAIERT